jgi:hypothetical protein
MKKLVIAVLVISFVNLIIGCSGSGIRIDKPPIGASVTIKLIDGSTRDGIILKKEGDRILYMDANSQKPENLEVKQIKEIVRAGKVYDLEGNVITEEQISETKGSSKMLAYSLGGLVAGAAVGFGVAAIVNSQGGDLAPIYPMAGLGLAGAIYFGMKGSQNDREDAIDDIREMRYDESQIQLKKRLEEEKQKLLKQKEEQEKLKQDIKKKQD